MTYPSDHSMIGVLPLQDHESGVSVGRRFYAAGGRIEKQGADGVVVWARNDGKGTLGDLVVYRHWPAASRGMGGWSPFYAVIGSQDFYRSAESVTVAMASNGGAKGGAPSTGGTGGGAAAVGGAGQPPDQGGASPLIGALQESAYAGNPSAFESYYGGKSNHYISTGLTPSAGGSYFGFRASKTTPGAVEWNGLQNVSGGGKLLGFFASRNGASFLGSVNVFVTKNNQSLFPPKGKNVAKKDQGGAVKAWMMKGGSEGVAQHRGSAAITPGDDDSSNVFVCNPIRHDGYAPDTRYKSLAHALPAWLPAWPKNTVAIGASATEETRQDNLVLHADPRMPCFDAAGDPAMSAWVVDGTPDDRMDCSGSDPTTDGRAAPLHSMMRVVRCASDMGDNAIAWQLTGGGKDERSGYGLVYGMTTERDSKTIGGGNLGDAKDINKGSGVLLGVPVYANVTKAGKAIKACATMAAEAGGPLSLGAASDKHAHPATKDGEPVNVGHIQTDACFFRNKVQDAPLEFSEREYPTDFTPGSKYVRVFLSYDGAAKHKCIGEERDGLWKWWAKVPFSSRGTTTPGGGLPDPTDPPPPPTITPGAPTTPGDGGGGGQGSGPTVTPSDELEDWITANDVEFYVDPQTGNLRSRNSDPNAPRLYDTDPGTTAALHVTNHAVGPLDSHVMFDQTVGFTSNVYRPQAYSAPGVVDVRSSTAVAESVLDALDAARPMVAREESWGAEQDGAWVYAAGSTATAGKIRTASGGVLFMPPQVDMMDLSTSFAPGGVTATTAYRAVAPGAFFAAGTPDLDTGDMADGSYRWGRSGTDWKLQVRISGTWTDVLAVSDAGAVELSGPATSAQTHYVTGDLTAHDAFAHDGTTFGIFGSSPTTQPAAIADAATDYAGPDTVDITKLNALGTKFDALLAAARSLGIIDT